MIQIYELQKEPIDPLNDELQDLTDRDLQSVVGGGVAGGLAATHATSVAVDGLIPGEVFKNPNTVLKQELTQGTAAIGSGFLLPEP